MGYAIGRKGGSAIEYWVYGDGRIPSQQDEVEALARILVEAGGLDQIWLAAFLESAGYANRAQLLADLFPDAADQRSHNLPLPPTPFVGRERELAALAALITNPDCRLITLVGPGGSGKTRLAVEAAKAAHPIFADGVAFIALAPLTSAEFVVATVATTLNFTLSGHAPPQTQLLHYLRRKALLLVLDNFEHLLSPPAPLPTATDANPALALVNGILQEAPTVTLLVTSRESIMRICQQVAGMPLALELAAAWVRVLSCREIAEEIEASLGFLTATLRNLPERHRSLQAVFDHSWKLLSAAEQSVFARCSVFRGGFTREAAVQVADATLASLTALVDKSFGHRVMIGLLLLRLGEMLYEQGDYIEAQTYCLRSLALFDDLGDPIRGSRALLYLGKLAMAQGDNTAAQELMEKSLMRLRKVGQVRAQIYALDALGRLAQRQSDYERARMLHQEGLTLSFDLGRQAQRAPALEALACLAARQGQAVRAATLFAAANGCFSATKAHRDLRKTLRDPSLCAEYDHLLAVTQAQLDEAEFSAAWATGADMELAPAVAYALASGPLRQR